MVDSEKETPKETEKPAKKVQKSVLRQSLSGGPQGLGDPDDNFLRKIELDVLIQEKIRYKSKKEKCTELVKDFNECSKEAGFLLPFKCRQENAKMQECLRYWFNNQEYRDHCTEEYLRERSEYRRTGIPPRRLNRKTRTWIESSETQK